MGTITQAELLKRVCTKGAPRCTESILLLSGNFVSDGHLLRPTCNEMGCSLWSRFSMILPTRPITDPVAR